MGPSVNTHGMLRRGHGLLPCLVTLTKRSSDEDARIHFRCEQEGAISTGKASDC